MKIRSGIWCKMVFSIISLLGLACILYFILNRSVESPIKHQTVDVYFNSTAEIARTDDDYICATLDWWPSDKCDYDSCSWGETSLLNLDLNDTILSNAVKAFSPLKIRMGGTLQDRLIYQTNEQQPCNPFIKDSSQFLGFSQGCLPMARWDDLNRFFKETGAVVTFGLNALTGRTINPDGSTKGAWDPSNAESLIRYTVNKGYSIYGWELGNELSARGIGARVTAHQYASDVKILQNLIEKVYVGSETKPLILGPGGFFDATWFAEFIGKTTKSLQAITHHVYNLGAGDYNGLVGNILDPSHLNGEARVFKKLQQDIRNSGTSAVSWVGEAGGAFNSGRNHVTNTFVMSFWYLDQLGLAATYNTKTYCRQTLIGGNYGLLDRSNFVPNPDYYSALLWHRLMGKQVLSTSVSGTSNLRAYTHCSKQSQGITLLLINLDAEATLRVNISTETGSISAENSGPFARKSKFGKMPIFTQNIREEYHLTAPERDLSSKKMLLNGRVLTVESSGGIPTLKPAIVHINDPITIAPFSIAFVHIPSIVSNVCK
ncbi:heparanase-like protein 3 [Chenopodium quinoa]|uniref:heparanase-like protein 3 n=1 Tax=Chenopodium quinoa TaxID=63459 RepID=UPI000B792879|nr:heparanase-like protein 3 [Chenopodium quinoa]